MTHPNFSIVIPTLNEANYLPSLLDDLVHQDYNDFEVIIVDAKSNDQTLAKASLYQKQLPHLSLITSQKRNVSSQRNLGAQKAHGTYLVFIDADTRIPPYFLLGLHYQLLRTQPDILTTFMEPDDPTPLNKSLIQAIILFMILQKETTKPFAIEGMLVFKRTVFQTLKGFNTTIVIGEGGDILERAHQQHHTFEIVSDPKYIFCLRRMRAQSTVKSIWSVINIQVARLINAPLSKKTLNTLYPMQGNEYLQLKAFSPAIGRKSLITQLKKNLNQIQQFLKDLD
jgi:glycosyltransferase involved in cell wall biosynthesis